MIKTRNPSWVTLTLAATTLASCRVDSPVERPHTTYGIVTESADTIGRRGSSDDTSEAVAVVAEESDVIAAVADATVDSPASATADAAAAGDDNHGPAGNTPPATNPPANTTPPATNPPANTTTPAPNPPATPVTNPSANNTPFPVTGNPQIPKGWYQFKGQQSGRCAEAPASADGTAFQIYDCQDSRAQQRILIESAGGNLYHLTTMNQKTVQGSATKFADGTALEQGGFASAANQLFTFEVSNDGKYYVIKAKDQNLVIDVAGGKTDNGAHLQFAYANGGGAQSWTLIPAK